MHAILAAVRKEHQYDGTIVAEAGGTVTPTARINILDCTAGATVVQMIAMEGQERTLVINTSKSAVFKNSATLVMPGAIDMYCSAGDVVSFIMESASTARCASYALKDNALPRAFTLQSQNEHWGTTAATEVATGDFTVATDMMNCHLSVTTSAATAMTITVPAITVLGTRPRRIYFRANNRQSAGLFILRGPAAEVAYYDNAGCDLTTIGGVTGIAYKGGTSCHGVIEFFADVTRMALPTDSVVVSRGSCLTLGS
jgi:hypothetical protein